MTILWIADCDPRTDADGCMAGDVQPFFDMVDSLGTIEFTVPSPIDPYDHRFTVPAEEQTGLLEGVGSLDAWDVSLQETIEPVVVVLEASDGVVLSRRSEP